jgi:uncharacterized protein YegJ (DUF2314 family)
MTDFGVLKGKTIVKIESSYSNLSKEDGLLADRDEVYIYTFDYKVYKMYHEQDCCENVYLSDVDGDWKDIIGSPVLMAEVVAGESITDDDGDLTEWTYYKLATIKGYVTLRWIGTSNGYYSVDVPFKEIN